MIRVLYAAVGITILLAGLVMLITPGPALAVIPIGLFILALEFSWAESALERSLQQAETAKRKAAETTRSRRARPPAPARRAPPRRGPPRARGTTATTRAAR